MQRMMALFCLSVTLSGPLLRQVEAASDLARALASLLDPGVTLSEPDGGVGDDRGEMTQKAGACHDLAHADPLSPDLWPANDCPSSLILAASLPQSASSSRRLDHVHWLPIGSAQRHAWLQHYLL